MANTDFSILDLSTDNLDLLNFPSLPFPVENDDLNFMAHMSGFLDPKLEDVNNCTQSTSQAQQCAPIRPQSLAQAQQQLQTQHQPAEVPSVSVPKHPYLSQPMVSQPALPQQKQHQQSSAQPLATPSFPQGFVQTGTTQPMQTPFALNSNSSFDSDNSEQKFVKSEPAGSYPSDGQHDLDDSCAATPRRSARKRNATEASRTGDQQQDWLQQKKKVGRPITYSGDPNAPELTEAERRRVKRRIANRESARRVQQRRKEMIDELHHKLLYVQHHHHHLMQHLARLEMEKGHLAGQLTEMKGKCTKSNTENVALTAQLNKLQQQLGQQAEQQLRNGQQSWGVQQGPSTPSQTPRRNSPAQNPFMVFK